MIGDSTDSLTSPQLRKIDVLRLYFNFARTVPESKKISSIVKQIEDRYRERVVRLKAVEAIRIKTKRLVKSCKDFIAKRKICRKPNPERRKQETFHSNLYNLFEITQNSSIEPITNESDNMETSDSFSSHESPAPSDSGNDNSDCDSDPDYDPSEDANDCSPKKKIKIPEDLLKKVSEIKGSYRMTESLLNVGLQIGSAEPSEFAISKSNLWSRITNLRSRQKTAKLSSLAADTSKVVIQFDGKSCTRLNERHVAMEERFVVLCHTDNSDVPLGFFAIDSKSGLHCSTQVVQTMNENCLSDRVIGLVCDTERTNTGRINGTCTLIEQTLERELLHLMCRHHSKEVLLKDVFVAVFGSSQSAKITTFDMLKENWSYIRFKNFSYSPIIWEELHQTALLDQLNEEAIETIIMHASNESIRNDYAELNDLVLKFLGKQTNKPFRVPGATSNARWMARAIYALKTYLFREHMDLDSEFVVSLERFCIFVALIYTKHWNRCTNPVDAPYNDLKLMKELDAYKEIDREIADVAARAHKRHLWYLSDELVVLTLFSDKVSNYDKYLMQMKLIRQVSKRTENSIIYTAEIDDIQNIELQDFISPRSFFLFEQLDLPNDFLDADVSDWTEMESYKKAKQIILNLITVVNDSAERALQFGANIISNQRVQDESRLQDFVVSLSN